MRRPDGTNRPTAALAATTTLLALVAIASVALPGVVASRSDAAVLVAARHLLGTARACAPAVAEPTPVAPCAASHLDVATQPAGHPRTLSERLLDLPPPTA